MKVALICQQLGVPTTLATTAFVTALADGFARIGMESLLVGLVRANSELQPEWDGRALEPFASATPWLDARTATNADATDASQRGIARRHSSAGYRHADWYDELLLERELERFAHGNALLLIVYPISTDVLAVASRIARRRGWLVVVQSCESLNGSWIDPKTRESFPTAVLEQADGVWVLSSYLAEFWQHHGVSSHRVLVQPNVVRASAFVETPLPGTSSAVFLGNLSHADADTLLEIAAGVRTRVTDFSVRIYGDAAPERRREFRDLITAAGLTEVVSLEPPVSPAEVTAVLGSADVALLPRAAGEFSQAGFPNKLGEYLASGRPVVVSGVGDVTHYLTDRESAMVVAPGDTQAFADAVVDVLSDGALAHRVGVAGAAVAKTLLDSATVAERLIAFASGLPSRAEAPTPAAPDAGWLARIGMVAGQRWRTILRGTRSRIGQRLRALRATRGQRS